MAKLIDIKLTADELEGTEATISQWLIHEGESIEKGEPLLELETDKVSMEICAPETGILKNILVKAGEKAEPELLLGILTDQTNLDYSPVTDSEQTAPQRAVSQNIESQSAEVHNSETALNNQLISPAVRRLLKENDLELSQIKGTGRDARVTRGDVKTFIATHQSQDQLNKTDNSSSISPSHSSKSSTSTRPESTLVPHSKMRQSIASHMVSSLLETSPHVTSVFEMDMSNLIEHRKWHKKEYAEQGVKLTFTAYFLKAMAQAVQTVPQVNASFHEHALEMFSDVNIGVGTALGDSGLVVPVVQNVQSLSLFDIAQALNEQTNKARNNKLTPSDMKNGTLTISNHGVSGSLFATPIIINQPQVAILGVGKLEKRVVVNEVDGEDMIEIKPKCYVSLSIDHRALDAHQTNLYLSEFVSLIENWGQ